MDEKELIQYTQKMNRELNNLAIFITESSKQSGQNAIKEKIEKIKQDLDETFGIRYNRKSGEMLVPRNLSQGEHFAFFELQRKIEEMTHIINTNLVQINDMERREYGKKMEEKLEQLRRMAAVSDSFDEKRKIGQYIQALMEKEKDKIKASTSSEEDLQMYENLQSLASSILQDIENQVQDMDEYKDFLKEKSKKEMEELSKQVDVLRDKIEKCSIVTLKKIKLGFERVYEKIQCEMENNISSYSAEETEAIFEVSNKIADILSMVSKKYETKLENIDTLFMTFDCLGIHDIKRLYRKAMNTDAIRESKNTVKEFNKQIAKVKKMVAAKLISAEVGKYRIAFLEAEIEDINQHVENLSTMKKKSTPEKETLREKCTNFFANKEWFRKKEKENISKKPLKFSRGSVIGGIAALGGIAIIGGLVYQNHQLNKENELLTNLKTNTKKVTETTAQYIKPYEEGVLAEKETSIAQEIEVATKEEKIMEHVLELRDKLNGYDAMHVTTEQALALFIHLNAANSFTEKNQLALDKITRENLIKKYYVGLIEGTEEFVSYTITDADLSRLAEGVYELRSAALNRVAVLNDQGKFAESREMISIFKDFVTEESLKDEVAVLTDSIASMQVNDSNTKKRELYRYYNYIFAGPKSGVRNFNQYGCYEDDAKKEITYENQGTTMHFYTWFMDCFTGLHTTNIIPQDIINSKNVKLMDQASLQRILGFKNCNASDFGKYYGVSFMDTPIENKNTTSSKNRGSSSTKQSKIAEALGNEQLDVEMHEQLQKNNDIGDTFKTSDGSTNTVIDTGDRSKTIAVVPDPSSEEIKDTTPSGETQKETTEGGGNEKEETIKFKEDNDEVVLDPGGDVIYDGTDTTYEEDIPFVEEETQIEFTPDETEEVFVIEVIDEVEVQQNNENQPEIQTEVSTSLSYINHSELLELKVLREMFIQTAQQNTIDTNEDFTYVKTYSI